MNAFAENLWRSRARPVPAAPQALLSVPRGPRRLKAFVASVAALDDEFSRFTRPEIAQRLLLLRAQMSLQGLSEAALVQAFALIRVVAWTQLGERPFETQLMAARVMLDGQLAEMATGEGKTLAAGICAATAALAGTPVHVITANDYLVARDATALRPLFRALGLSVGHVVAEHDPAERRRAYDCDITYCTAKELVFDYLRDRVGCGVRTSQPQPRAADFDGNGLPAPHTLLRGLCMAVVDEADSVFIDEARVPKILATGCGNVGELDYHGQALQLAKQMRFGVDFHLDIERRRSRLTGRGASKLEWLSQDLNEAWDNRRRREETVCLALVAWHLYQSERDYLVHQAAVVMLDQAGGPQAPGRAWSRGLRQLIELKEGCQPTQLQVTAAQITHQRFFARYLRLGGMSGTLREVRSELASVYALQVVKIPLQRPARRLLLPTRLVRDRQAQWRAATECARELVAEGRPVLIGTDSVADSQSLSRELTRAGLAHQVLNACHDLREARIVAEAGQAARITVATNMAGRGTDIALAEGVAERGGLHVICCQHNASSRIDRQLIGRCARQGDPGSAQTLVRLSKPPIARHFSAWFLRCVASLDGLSPQWLVALVQRLPQRLQERRQRAQRQAVQQQDERVERELWAGVGAQ